MTQERKKGAKGGARTELVGVRFDPETRYLMEMAARAQRRSVANYVEWAVDESFKRTFVEMGDNTGHRSISDLRNALWDPEEADRLCILGARFPHLLKHDEQKLWKLISDVWSITQPAKDLDAPMKGPRLDKRDLELVRVHWEKLKAFAAEDVQPSVVARSITSAAAPVALAVIPSKTARTPRKKGGQHG